MALTSRLAVAAAAAGLLVGIATAATAHGGAGSLEVQEVTSTAPGTATVRLLVTYQSDGEPAEGAIVDAVATGPGGEAGPTIRLEQAERPGVRTGSFAVGEQGRWTISVTSAFPPGSTDVVVDVAADGTITGDARPPTTGPPTTEPPTTVPPVSPLVSVVGEGSGSDGPGLEPPEAGGAEGGSDTTNLVVAAVSGIAGGAGGLWVSRRRAARKRALADG